MFAWREVCTGAGQTAAVKGSQNSRSLIRPQHLIAEARNDHPLDRATAGGALPDGFQNDIRSLPERVAAYLRADGRENDALAAVLFSER